MGTVVLRTRTSGREKRYCQVRDDTFSTWILLKVPHEHTWMTYAVKTRKGLLCYRDGKKQTTKTSLGSTKLTHFLCCVCQKSFESLESFIFYIFFLITNTVFEKNTQKKRNSFASLMSTWYGLYYTLLYSIVLCSSLLNCFRILCFLLSFHCVGKVGKIFTCKMHWPWRLNIYC